MTNEEKLKLKNLIELWESEDEDDIDEFLEEFDACINIFRKMIE